MGLLDRAFDMLEDNHFPLLDSRTRLLQAALSLVANNGQAGGLHGLVERFQEAGLGNVIQSWIADGPNIEVSAGELQQVLGEGHLQQIAEETGYAEPDVARRLSAMLPDLVDQLTPEGRIPRGGVGNMSALLDHFMGGFH
ncbi:YidB family protein [Noviherbaspirillum aridicola]|uniref:DUF937 domain-containing protein n=1 Tax=Noviherbaspirillum aridicola TaxID=2849687 RepID=A0ABQ4Q1I5_9BURK|nr:YidB family protein [Noviherbaspirillum aridicola]GIZ50650.1 hypothetical protein NCCP691_06640 [Noviherbaspirillum aridicola]